LLAEQDVIEKVYTVMVDEFEIDPDQLNAEAKLYDDLGLDSLDYVDLIIALEKTFDFKIDRQIDEEELRAIRTLQDIYDFIMKKIKDFG